jgi:serine/threonine protein kinase
MALRNSDHGLLPNASCASVVEHEAVAAITAPNPTTRPIARSLKDGYSFGRYQIVRLIAIGGMSEVYEAVHNGLDKRVALKVLRPELAQNSEARERFVSEGVNAARIRHTNVVDVTDVGIVDELPYLVMSLLEGEDLGMLYDRQGALPIADLADLLLPVACAVAVGHAQGVVHRDLKPDNIFLHCEGCRLIPKVLDFGVSRSMYGRRITPNARVFGTPHYMSPEQARGQATDPATDQYALGVILYEGVTGQMPRDSTNALELLHAVAFDPFVLPSAHLDLPPELEAVIVRAMSHRPEDRFESMIAFAAALLPFASEASREYWSVELNSLPSRRTTPPPSLLPIARPPSHPAESPVVSPLRDSQPSAHVVLQTEAVEPPTIATSRDSARAEAAVAISKPARRPRTVFWLGTAAGAVLALGGAWLTTRSHPTTSSITNNAVRRANSQFEVDVQILPPTAAMFLDGKQVAVGRYRASLPRDGRWHELRANADGFVAQSQLFRDEPPPRELALTRQSAPEPAPILAEPATIAEAPSAVSSRTSVSRPRTSPARASGREAARRLDATVSDRHIAVIDSDRPKVRIVDEFEPHVRIIE